MSIHPLSVESVSVKQQKMKQQPNNSCSTYVSTLTAAEATQDEVIKTTEDGDTCDRHELLFAGETLADTESLLHSLQPLLVSMKICGLYFNNRSPSERQLISNDTKMLKS